MPLSLSFDLTLQVSFSLSAYLSLSLPSLPFLHPTQTLFFSPHVPSSQPKELSAWICFFFSFLIYTFSFLVAGINGTFDI